MQYTNCCSLASILWPWFSFIYHVLFRASNVTHDSSSNVSAFGFSWPPALAKRTDSYSLPPSAPTRVVAESTRDIYFLAKRSCYGVASSNSRWIDSLVLHQSSMLLFLRFALTGDATASSVYVSSPSALPWIPSLLLWFRDQSDSAQGSVRIEGG